MRTHHVAAVDQEFTLSVLIGHGSSSGVVDLCNLKGRNWVRGISIRQQIDAPVADCEVRISREEYEINFSPLDGNSILNATHEPLTIGHMLIVTVTDSSGAHEVFRGYVDAIDWAQPIVTIRARDLAGRLQDTFSEIARMYAVGRIPYGVRLWTPSGAATLGEWIAPERLADSGATSVYEVTVAGTFDDEAPGQGGNAAWATNATPFTNGGVTLRKVTVGASNWSGLTGYAWGDVVMPVDNGTERAICIQAGTSEDVEPTWTATTAEGIDDGTVRWAMLPAATDGGLPLESVMTAIIKDNVASVPEIYHPVHSGYWRNPFVMPEQSILEQLRQLALEIGWDLRVRYVGSGVSNHEVTPSADDGWGYWRLYLYEPARASTTEDFDLNASDVINVSQCGLQLAPIRNVVSVTYSEMTEGGSVQTRKNIKVTDSSSITKYGRRFMGVGEGSASGINTSTEATALANAILSDLKDPGLEFSVELPFRWWIEINDLIEFPSTGAWTPFFNSAQKLAVVSIEHRLEASGNNFHARTVIGTRGKPTAGTRAWHERASGAGRAKPALGFTPEGAGDLTVEASVKGGRIKFKRPGGKVKKPKGGFSQDAFGENVQAELYMSTSSGFTPGIANLKATTFTDEFNLAGLATGTAQYFRIGLRDKLGNLSTLSPETAITPTQAELGDLDDGLKVACCVTQVGDLDYEQLNNMGKLTKFTEVIFNDGSGWDTVNQKFVAPADGVYQIDVNVVANNAASVPDPLTYDSHMHLTGHIRAQLYLGGSGIGSVGAEGPWIDLPPGYARVGLSVSASLLLDEDDEVEVYLGILGVSGAVQIFRPAPCSNYFRATRVWSR